MCFYEIVLNKKKINQKSYIFLVRIYVMGKRIILKGWHVGCDEMKKDEKI